MATLRKTVTITAGAALVVLGFVGAAWAASAAPAKCIPGTYCRPSSNGGGGGGGGSSTTTTPTSTTSTVATPTPSVRFAPTLAASARTIDFGRVLVLSGKVSGGAAGQPVDLLSQSCGFSGARVIAQPKLRPDGTFTFRIEPLRNATFAVRYAGETSRAVAVRVRPTVALRLHGGLYAVDVSAGGGTFFSGKAVIELFDRTRHGWRTVGSGALRPSSSPTALVAVSSTTIRAAVHHGARVRAAVTRSTVGKCFVPATSSPLGA